MAEFYLEEANYDLSLALQAYKEDSSWEENAKNYLDSKSQK